MLTSTSLKFALSAALLAALAACGGGGGESGSTSATSVRVFGDSLADTGTFGGLKATVAAAGDGGTATPMWVDRIASTYGLGLCNYYSGTDFRNLATSSFSVSQSTCKNFAVSGGRINNLSSSGGANSPVSIPKQMDDAAAVAGNTFPANEVILVDGGGNDAADLIGAYLGAATNPVPYITMLSSLIPPTTVSSTIATTGGAEKLAGMYMTALANKFADDISNKLLARGAQRVVVLNTPAVTSTPRFKLVLQSISAAAGAAAAAQIESLAKTWTVAFNSQLNTRLSGNSKVAIVDFYTEFNTQISNPGQFSLTNVTTPVCPIVGTDEQGMPTYNFLTCTAALLDQTGPKGWRSYAFSDGFHPTPYGHQLLAQLVSRTLAVKGWL